MITVLKASGEKSSFSREKLIHSLKRAGARSEIIDSIVQKVEASLFDGITTREIYKMAYDMLHHDKGPAIGKFKLKQGIIELGPTGYLFEKYVGALLKQEGYRVQTGIILDGKCVRHEIDVLAQKENVEYIVECKFHNTPGILCDVKVPLYIHSRFRDVESYRRQHSNISNLELHGWLVTNTHFTKDALQYAGCAGLKLMSWSYPEDNSLRYRIDHSGLYPVTCLTTLSKTEKKILLDEEIIICKELLEMKDILNKVGISPNRQIKVLKEAESLSN